MEYAHIDGTTLHLQIITPQTRNTKESDETYPCIVYVQGSAWMKQNINAKLGLLARLSERGYVIAPFPAQAVDTRNAIRYVKLHAKEYKADANQMYVGGDICTIILNFAGKCRWSVISVKMFHCRRY